MSRTVVIVLGLAGGLLLLGCDTKASKKRPGARNDDRQTPTGSPAWSDQDETDSSSSDRDDTDDVEVTYHSSRSRMTAPTQRDRQAIEKLRIGDKIERINAADALGNNRAGAPACVKALTEVLSDDDAEVRSHSAYALHRIGPDAKDALPALDEAVAGKMAGPEDLTIVRAALAISSIDLATDRGVKVLLATLRDPKMHTNVRKESAFALGEIGPRTAEVIPALKAASKTRGVAAVAMAALRTIAANAKKGT